MVKVVVVFLNFSHSVLPSVFPKNAPTKTLWPDETNNLSDGSSMNLFGRVGLVDTWFPLLYCFPLDILMWQLWIFGGVFGCLRIIGPPPSHHFSLGSRYPGWCDSYLSQGVLPQTNHFLSSQSVLILSWKSVWYSENSGLMSVLWGGVGLPSAFRYGDECIANWRRVIENLPALVHQCHIHLNSVKVLWVPGDGPYPIYLHNLLVAVFIEVMDHNKVY